MKAIISNPARLDSIVKAAKNVSAAPTNAARIGVLKKRRTSRQHRGFFYVRHHGTSPYGWAVRGIARCAGPFSRYANPHGSAHPDWRQGERFASSAEKEATMAAFVRRARRAQSPRFPTPSPSLPAAARVDAWRLQALLEHKLYPAACVTSSLMGGWFGVSDFNRLAGTSGRGSINPKGGV